MRIALVGKTSFIAQHIHKAALDAGIELQVLGHNELSTAAFQGTEAVVNCTMHPQFRDVPYAPQIDTDLQVAGFAVEAGASFTMLSSRRVYPANVRWNAAETAAAGGDETLYGRNKAESEKRVNDLNLKGLAVFRMSNIFGYEYGRSRTRRTFMGLVLTALREKNHIVYDMSPDVLRDFLPVESAAVAIVRQLERNLSGIYNLGCGFPVRCGDIAQWIMDGYGRGQLIVHSTKKVDEFFLNMDKSHADLNVRVTLADLKEQCMNLGRRLQCEKY